MLGLLVGLGVGFLLGEIAIAFGAPFGTAYVILGVCAVVGGLVGWGRDE